MLLWSEGASHTASHIGRNPRWVSALSPCTSDRSPYPTLQDPTGEAATEVQKHLTLYELDLGVNNVVSGEGGERGERGGDLGLDLGVNNVVSVRGGRERERGEAWVWAWG